MQAAKKSVAINNTEGRKLAFLHMTNGADQPQREEGM